ncbi:Uu.00g065140.m01.CDS01 [Anthostomella pinea]|uniref:Uu.00g065140.m01.CDS01 n=1 Tax=Anthostomella pinea TaxID=933095 RepID=A0AAI8VUG5_9PEZI|nr:Uu.00g065140.m01.CDS01 [Anthostomella pinea]
MSQANYIKKVAIVGATGTVGKPIVEALLKLGKHELTALTRQDSNAIMPQGLKATKVNYAESTSLAAGLAGQDALIITLPGTTPQATHFALIEAAAAAKVPFILPNLWGIDVSFNDVGRDLYMGPTILDVCAKIEEHGVSAWMGMVTGFWYEFSLGMGPNTYGMDWKNRTFTFFDDGETLINTITWPQTGRAVANLLSLPISPAPASPGAPSLSNYKNKYVYTSSFLMSQKEMFASVLRVSGTSSSDWTLKYQPSAERVDEGKKELGEGKGQAAYQKLLYSRVFYPDGTGNFEGRRGLDNEVLGLPREDMDEFTRIAIERAEQGIGYGH